jgi:hypothetical protein
MLVVEVSGMLSYKAIASINDRLENRFI